MFDQAARVFRVTMAQVLLVGYLALYVEGQIPFVGPVNYCALGLQYGMPLLFPQAAGSPDVVVARDAAGKLNVCTVNGLVTAVRAVSSSFGGGGNPEQAPGGVPRGPPGGIPGGPPGGIPVGGQPGGIPVPGGPAGIPQGGIPVPGGPQGGPAVVRNGQAAPAKTVAAKSVSLSSDVASIPSSIAESFKPMGVPLSDNELKTLMNALNGPEDPSQLNNSDHDGWEAPMSPSTVSLSKRAETRQDARDETTAVSSVIVTLLSQLTNEQEQQLAKEFQKQILALDGDQFNDLKKNYL